MKHHKSIFLKICILLVSVLVFTSGVFSAVLFGFLPICGVWWYKAWQGLLLVVSFVSVCTIVYNLLRQTNITKTSWVFFALTMLTYSSLWVVSRAVTNACLGVL